MATPGLVSVSGSREAVGVSCRGTPSPDPAPAGSPSPPRGRGPGDESLASPKSKIFACPRAVTKMFAGLMSR